MRTLSRLVPIVLFGAACGVQACGSIKLEDQPPPNGRELPIAGVIRGTVIYQGPPPCSQNGHIVGNAVLLAFDRRNPPPPSGLATTAVNFVAVSGDVLFSNEPREPGPNRYCPADNGDTRVLTVSAPFAMSPMPAGSFMLQAFFDYTGDFLPTFNFRRLPMAGDIGGGYVDTSDANQLVDDPNTTIRLADGGVMHPQVPKSSNPNYQPVFLPIDIGVPGPAPAGSLRGVPIYTMPPDGYVADNVTVTIGVKLPLARPYFYSSGPIASDKAGLALPPDSRYDLGTPSAEKIPSQVSAATPANPEANPFFVPIGTMTQDYQVYAQPPPAKRSDATINSFQKKFPAVQVNYGVPQSELAVATDPADPFHLQIGARPKGNGGIFVWWDGTTVPEGTVPRLWPLVVFAKLKDNLSNGSTNLQHTADPQSNVAQGSDGKEPVVIIQGLTLWNDSLSQTLAATPSTRPEAANLSDHVTVLVRPSVLCLDPRHMDRGGLLVTPHATGPYPPEVGENPPRNDHPLFQPSDVQASQPQLIGGFQLGCLPQGRYSLNVVYPTGQAWTVPNEMGSCAQKEGAIKNTDDPTSCTAQTRPVLLSQGNRNVIEIVPPAGKSCEEQGLPVPPACLTLPAE